MYELYKAGELVFTVDDISHARKLLAYLGGKSYIQYTESGILKYEGEK